MMTESFEPMSEREMHLYARSVRYEQAICLAAAHLSLGNPLIAWGILKNALPDEIAEWVPLFPVSQIGSMQQTVAGD